MSEQQPTEEELRAAYEAEIKKIRIEQVLLENVVSLVNVGMRRTGLAPGTEDERDAEQVRLAIDSIRALMPMVERVAPQQAGPIRDAVSQLQLAFVKIGGAATESGTEAAPSAPEQPPPPPPPPKPGEPGPAQRTGKLWVPGQ
jgi:hypothetical protein